MLKRRYLFALLFTILLVASCDGIKVINSRSSEEVQVVQPDVQPDVKEVERTILFFTSRGCPPCEAAKPKVRAIRLQGVEITELDFHANPELVRKYGITHTPTFIVLEDGVEIERTSSITTLILILVRLLSIVLPLLLG